MLERFAEKSQTVRTKKGTEKVAFTLLSLPIYAVEELPRLINFYKKTRD